MEWRDEVEEEADEEEGGREGEESVPEVLSLFLGLALIPLTLSFFDVPITRRGDVTDCREGFPTGL